MKSETSYEVLPREITQSRPTSSHVTPTVQAHPDTPQSEPAPIEPESHATSSAAANAAESQPVEPPHVQAVIPPTITQDSTTDWEDEPDVIPGSWPKDEDEKSPSESSHSPSMSFDDVNDKIASQMAELERDRASVGLGLGDITTNGMSQVTVTNLSREPIVLNRTELTPIMETSPRESMVSDTVEQMGTPRIVTPKSHVTTPLPTRHSSASKKRPTSPDSLSSSQSGERSRTASLTSQADRLRNKFLYGNRSSQRDLVVDTDAASPAVLDRRNQFESLIRSGETMKMTLTPTSLRSIEVITPTIFQC